jgi:hypothetical protein
MFVIIKSFRLKIKLVYSNNRDTSVGIATGYTVGVRFPEGVRDLSLLHSVQTGSEAYGGTAAGA